MSKDVSDYLCFTPRMASTRDKERLKKETESADMDTDGLDSVYH